MLWELGTLNNLLTSRNHAVLVGHLPEETYEHMHVKHNMIHFSNSSLMHILSKHKDIQLVDLLIIPRMLSDGLWIGDRNKSCCISYYSPEKRRHFIGAVKSAKDGSEHYFTTFHKAGKRQLKSKINRGKILRKNILCSKACNEPYKMLPIG